MGFDSSLDIQQLLVTVSDRTMLVLSKLALIMDVYGLGLIKTRIMSFEKWFRCFYIIMVCFSSVTVFSSGYQSL